jgi:hypothetical protein
VASQAIGALKILLQADTAAFEAKLKGADASVVRFANRLKQDLEPSQRAVNSAVRDFLGTREIGRAEAYAQAVKEIGGANKLTAGDQQRVNRAVQEALGHYKALGQEAPAHLKKLAADTKAAQVSTANLGGALQTMKGVLGAFGLQLGASALISFTENVFASADAVGDLATKMGVSVEAAQRFQYAARQSGAEIEDVSAAVLKMSNNLAEGDESTVAALDAVGLKFADIRALKPEDAFRAIADAIGRIADPMEQARLALDLFGKGGAALLPMIREHSLEVADSVEVMSDDTVRELKDAQQAWENFWNGVTVATGNALAFLAREIPKTVQEVTQGATFLARIASLMAQGASPGAAAEAALWAGYPDFLERQKAQQKAEAGRMAGFNWSQGSDVQEMGGAGFFGMPAAGAAKHFTKAEIEARAKAQADALKKATAELKKQEEAAAALEATYQKFRRET